MNKRRGWGEGSVHFAPARNEWVGMASLGVGPDGKRRRLAVYAPSKKLALQKLADLRARTGARAPDKRQTLREFAEAWLEGTVKVKRRATTFRSYAGITRNHIVPTIGNVRVDRLELADVDRCLGAVLERSGVSMAAKARTVLNLIMRRAVREKAALHNPVTAHESDTVPKRQMSFLTSEQLTKLFEAAAGDRFEALPILLATSGLRIGEARALTWGDVDLDARVIRITKTAQEASGAIVIVPPKTDAGRRNVALTPATVKALRKRKSLAVAEGFATASDPVFPSTTGTIIRHSNLYRRWWAPLREKAGVAKIRLHDLRHSAASLSLLAGTDAKVVAVKLGHTDPAFTMRTYQHVVDSLQQADAAAIDRLFAPKKKPPRAKTAIN